MSYKEYPYIKISCFDARLGASEQRTEPYKQYGKGVAQCATTPGAKSSGGVSASGGEQANATGGFYA